MDEWEKVFCESIPVKLQSELEEAADYMLYLFERGELSEINKPLAYLKSMRKQGYPATGWPKFSNRLKKKQELAKKKRAKAQKEEEIRQENIRLREKWKALSDTEKQKWITEGSKRESLKLLSGSTKGFLAWLEAQNPTNSNK